MGLGHCIQVNFAFVVYRFLHTYPHRRVSWNTSPLSHLLLPWHFISSRTLTISSTSSSHTFCATYNHLGSFTVLPVHAWYPQVYACAGVPRHYVSPLLLFKGKKISSVGIWRPRRFSCSWIQIPYVWISPHWARLFPFRVRVSNCD